MEDITTIHIKTPALALAEEVATYAFQGVKQGDLDCNEASKLFGGASQLRLALAGEINARIKEPQPAAAERRRQLGAKKRAKKATLTVVRTGTDAE
jgi:hypothetical protein